MNLFGWTRTREGDRDRVAGMVFGRGRVDGKLRTDGGRVGSDAGVLAT